MFTLFAVPRAFRDPRHADIQHKAIRSWISLKPRPEILLIGNEEGIKEVCEQYGLRHVPHVRTNEYGVPYLNSAIEQAIRHASHDILCYVNADIVVSSNLTTAIAQIKEKKWRKFLMTAPPHVIDFSLITHFEPGFERELLPKVLIKPIKVGGQGDIFAFTKKTYILSEIPDLVIGRGYFDFWFSTYAVLHLIPTVDATDFVTLFHPIEATSTHCSTQIPSSLKEQLLTNLLRYPFTIATLRNLFAYTFDSQGNLSPNPVHKGLPPVFALWLRMLVWEVRNYTLWRRSLKRWDLKSLKETGADERLRMYGLDHAIKRLFKFAKTRLMLYLN